MLFSEVLHVHMFSISCLLPCNVLLFYYIITNEIPNHFTWIIFFVLRKDLIYYVAIATVTFSQVKITCYFHMWRYHAFMHKSLCIGHIEASTSPPPPRATPGHLTFWKWLFKFPATQSKMPFKCPTQGSIKVIKCLHPGDISQTHKWQKDGRNAFSCGTKSL